MDAWSMAEGPKEAANENPSPPVNVCLVGEDLTRPVPALKGSGDL